MRVACNVSLTCALLLVGCPGPGGNGDGSGDGTDGAETGDDASADGVDGTADDDDEDDDDADGDDDDDDDTADDDDDDDDDSGGPLCGNGTLDPGEDCDDGNDEDQDWCTSTCQIATCGDGIVWTAAETCDDGNTDNGDGCSSACGLDTCGDAVVDPGEQCDLGAFNGTNGALCSAVCVSAGVDLDELRSFRVNQTGHSVSDPRALAVADFNDDGLLDIAVGARTYSFAAVTLAYGQPAGEFWTAYEVARAGGSGHVEALGGGQDLDGDGRADVVALVGDDSLVAYSHLGNDRAVATNAAHQRPLSSGTGFMVDDATGDGQPDLISMWTAQDVVQIASGLGTGAFESAFSVHTDGADGGEDPTSVTVGDVSGDDTPDLAVGTLHGDVVILRGSGTGGFLPPQIHAMATTEIRDVQLADVDGDGLDDAIAVVPSQNEVAVALSQGDGTFGVSNDYPTAGQQPVAVALVELDGDGDPDIVTADAATQSLSVFHGVAGGGAFGPPVSYELGAAGDAELEVVGLTTADLDEDGLLDVIVDAGPAIFVLLSDGAGGFEAPQAYRPGFRNCCDREAILAADFTDDGHVDLAVAYLNSFNILAGDGEGRLLPAFTETAYSVNAGTRSIAVGNLDGAGPPDFGVSASNGHLRGVVEDSGWFQLEGPTATSASAAAQVLADVDGDGLDERIACTSGGDLSLWVYPSDPDLDPYSLDLGGNQCDGLVAADFDGDGNLDLAEAADPVGVALVFGDGDHGWSSPTAVPGFVPNGVHGLIAADVNEDGLVDLIGGGQYDASASAGFLTIVLGEPGGEFAAPSVVSVEADGVWMEDLAIGDFNGDLRLDVAATSFDSSTVAIAIGFGNGEFAEPQVFELPGLTRAITAGDFDGDGIADIALGGSEQHPFGGSSATLDIMLSEGHIEL